MLGNALCAIITEDGAHWKGDTSAAIVTNGMTVRTIVGLLRSFVRLRFPHDETSFNKLLDKIGKLERIRDALAHACWTRCEDDPEKIEPWLVKSVGGLRRAVTAYSAKELDAHTDLIKQKMLAIVAYQIAWGIAPPLPIEDDKPTPS